MSARIEWVRFTNTLIRPGATYHRTNRSAEIHWTGVTNCGLVLPVRSSYVDRKAADAFANPCIRCFPEVWS